MPSPPALRSTAAPAAATLDRIKETGHIRLGYLTDARPFSFQAPAARPRATPSQLCKAIAETLKTRARAAGARRRLGAGRRRRPLRRAVKQGTIDLLCAPTSETLAAASRSSFSIPIFAGGNRRGGARRRAAAAARRRWRTSASRPARLARHAGRDGARGHDVRRRPGTTRRAWLNERGQDARRSTPRSRRCRTIDAGISGCSSARSTSFFGDRAVMLGARIDDATRDELVVLDRQFTHEPLALALARGDDDFRLAGRSRTEPTSTRRQSFADAVREVVRRARREGDARSSGWNTLPE